VDAAFLQEILPHLLACSALEEHVVRDYHRSCAAYVQETLHVLKKVELLVRGGGPEVVALVGLALAYSPAVGPKNNVGALLAGLPAQTRLYDLRYTCATLLLNSNFHPKYVRELLGHASIAQTLDTYSHVLKGMDGGISDVMDEALG
jgi:integrase